MNATAPGFEGDVVLWSELKAIQHALDRTLSLPASEIRELDCDRLHDLEALLWREIARAAGDQPNQKKFRAAGFATATLVPEISIRDAFQRTPIFDSWQPEYDFESKIIMLLQSLEEYLEQLNHSHEGLTIPKREFTVLRSALSPLLQVARAPVHF
jgi:hypothetical protein